MKLLLKLVFWGLMVGVAMGLGLAGYAVTLLPELPTIEEIRRVPLNVPLRIYNRDGQLIAEYGNERRIPVTLDKTPPLLIDAVLATEDNDFYHHSGVDFRGILRAVWNNIRSKSRGQGASTITMQVARNFFLTPEKTYTRKLKEILLAFHMERALTKDEILELYLNKIFLGHRAYGFAAAAQVYYGVGLANLSVPEITMLAGLPKAPSRDNPISNPQRAAERRAYVLNRMHRLGRIDDLSYRTARQAPVTAARHVAEVEAKAPFVAEMARRLMVERFGERVYELGYRVTVTVSGEHQASADAALRRGLLAYDRRHGFRGPLAHVNLTKADAVNIAATGDAPPALHAALRKQPKSRELIPAVVLAADERSITAFTQQGERIRLDWPEIKWARAHINPNHLGPELTSAAEVVGRGDLIHASSRVAGDGSRRWRLDQLPRVSGGLVSLDPHSGAILALTGGFDYYLSKFNRVTQALRQPGSNIKPFIYSAALEHGFTPGSLVSAAPIVIEDPLEGIWRPRNYSGKFFGPTRLRNALSRSLNLVSVRLVRAMGIDAAIEHLAKFGFDAATLPRSFSLALGSISATPLDIAAAFAVFANGGKRARPYLIEEIVDGDGNEVTLSLAECSYCRRPALETPRAEAAGDQAEGAQHADADRAISEQNAFLIHSMLQQVIVSGTGRRALALKRADLAGKTGTTNDYRDAWFSGFNQDIITTVFVGFDEPSHLGRRESGASAALPIWVDYMGEALADYPERPITPPADITSRFINQDSGLLTRPDDPDGYWEYYQQGSEPTATSSAATGAEKSQPGTLF